MRAEVIGAGAAPVGGGVEVVVARACQAAVVVHVAVVFVVSGMGVKLIQESG